MRVLLEILGLASSFLILSASMPQLLEVLRRGSNGVSAGSWSLFMIASVLWAVYGWKIDSPATLIGNIVATLAFSTLVGALLAERLGRVKALAAVVATVGVFCVLAVVLPTAVLAVVGVLFGFSLSVPQLLTSWRSRGLPSTVSLTAWTMVVLGQVGWLLYGLLRPEWPIFIMNVVAGSISFSVLMIEWRKPALPQDQAVLVPVRVR
jgi:uncharacterized protein with PQ loop repeat